MTVRVLLIELWGLLTRFFPWPAPIGLQRLGDPGRDSPVMLSGNYRVTVDRLRRALRGRDVWLLVVNSRGINVWCAASGGHLTTSDVITALRSSGVADRVDHRDLLLPGLCATGVEPRIVETRTGWRATFGPVRAVDIGAFLDRGAVTRPMRTVRFELPARLEMGAMWGLPAAGLALLIGGLTAGLAAGGIVAGAALLTALALFAATPRIPARGRGRWGSGGGAAVLFVALAAGGWSLGSHLTSTPLLALVGIGLLLGITFAADLAGSTPLFPSDLHPNDRFRVEVLPERCSGDATCAVVCPRSVMQVRERTARVARPEACLRCGACLVQCPEDALRFLFEDGRCVTPETVRRTKLNLLGKRAKEIPPASSPRSG